MRSRLALVILAGLAVASLFYGAWRGRHFEFSMPPVETPLAVLDATFDQPMPTLLVGGDVMLGRKVEWYMRTEGLGYPFTYVRDLFARYDAVLINFEGTVPKTHVPTPSMGFTFSFAEDIAASITGHGVTHAGLANNHAFDYGTAGYVNTREVLRAAGLVAFGHPDQVRGDDVEIITVGSRSVAFIPIHAVFKERMRADMEAAFAAASTSDMQVAFVHWGTEYDVVHSPAQERMAMRMAELGADLIIGHHPHVVQDIAYVDDTPVFYSLGNLIFDQYWEENVRTGLLLGLSEEKGGLRVELIPIRSVTQSMPELLVGEERQEFLDTLALRSAPSLGEAIQAGVLRFY